jgi:hypothetical protein
MEGMRNIQDNPDRFGLLECHDTLLARLPYDPGKEALGVDKPPRDE